MRLLHEVYTEREKQISEKLDKIGRMKQEFADEVKRIDQEVRNDDQWTREKEMMNRRRIEEYKHSLNLQIREKEMERDRERASLEELVANDEKEGEKLRLQIQMERAKQKEILNLLRTNGDN